MTYRYARRAIVRRLPELFSFPLDMYCGMCGCKTVCRLPPTLLAEQPDETNAVCLPSIGGCNQGWYVP
jgi:hypothetical protein